MEYFYYQNDAQTNMLVKQAQVEILLNHLMQYCNESYYIGYISC
jgi:hypothetical protein